MFKILAIDEVNYINKNGEPVNGTQLTLQDESNGLIAFNFFKKSTVKGVAKVGGTCKFITSFRRDNIKKTFIPYISGVEILN